MLSQGPKRLTILFQAFLCEGNVQRLSWKEGNEASTMEDTMQLAPVRFTSISDVVRSSACLQAPSGLC